MPVDPSAKDQLPGLQLDCALPRAAVQDRLAAPSPPALIEEPHRREIDA